MILFKFRFTVTKILVIRGYEANVARVNGTLQ